MDAAPTQLSSYHDLPPAPQRSANTNSGSSSHNLQQQQQQQQQHSRHQLYSLPTGSSQPQQQQQEQQQQLYYTSDDTHSPSPPSTSTSSWQQLRPTSNSRDESRAAIRQQYQEYQTDRQEQQVKREQQQHQQQHQHPSSMAYNIDEKSSSSGNGAASQPTLPPPPPRAAEDPMPSTSDFVKKLYKMLEDPSFQSVVCWGPLGDCFVVKDMNEFTKSILPRMFKHSNFASFVRQLNKYDFHKVKNTDDNQFGEHSWTFRHPDFHADRRDALENIKRKVPAQRKYTPAASASVPASSTAPYLPSQSSSYPYPPSSSTNPPSSYPGGGPGHIVGGSLGGNGGRRSPSPSRAHLTAEIQRLKDEGDDLRGRIRNLERNYENVLVELVGFQRGMAQQDGLMQSLIGWFLEGGKGPKPAIGNAGASGGQQHASLTSSPQTPLQQQQQQQQNGQQQPQNASDNTLSAQQKLRQHLLQAQAQLGGGNGAPPSSGGGGGNFATFGPSSISDPTLFLPPQAVQRIGGQQGEIGRASLMQMSELSRRAALNASGNAGSSGGGAGYQQQQGQVDGAGRLWSFSGEGPTQGGQDGGQQQPRSRSEQLAQLREFYSQRQGGASTQGQGQAQTQGGWSGDSTTHSRDRSQSHTSFSESREREMEHGGGGQEGGEDMKGAGRQHQQQQQQQQRRSSDSAAAFGSRAMQEQQMQQQQQQQSMSQVQSPASVSSHISSTQATPASNWSMMLQPPSPYDSPQQSQSTVQSQSQSQAPQMLGPVPAPTLEGEVMTHEGLQVYTVGHLLPRNTYIEDAQGNWSFDPAALTSGAMISGMGMSAIEGALGPDAGEARAQGYGNGGDGDENEEVVRPSPSSGSFAIPPAPSSLQSSGANSSSSGGSGSGSGQSGATQQKLRVRRSTFVPGWAVPPRVLLVDDDAVSRKLSSKFLKVFGCTTDVAVDGIGAVNKMNLEKYDLVLMDIVMPKLDGVSATNLIRKFDQGTPIISMTSNSKPNEIMTYYSSGMNDILPKPFTKEGLLDMLEKHLMHLKVIQQMSRLSRPVGIPPLSDSNFEQALTQGANSLRLPSSLGSNALVPSSSTLTSVANAPSPFSFQFFGDGGDVSDMNGMGRVNPLAGMGLTDEQYSVILQNIVNGDGLAGMMEGLDSVGMGGVGGAEKRSLEDGEEERGVKRSRFEVVE